ncbi:MAG: DUF721 domain-containing protein [Proteobacteria bacterium]|nr:DUF721 domain-containing protein [Cystobacterineae bacterium]MCL2259128.1 DUF721 domain-containing protein [Cystobacterineae bacterium]MCL2315299.1 DUF721 domain-containing protein [Pseudomonadota bacterium]
MKRPHDFEALNALLPQWLGQRKQNSKQNTRFLPQNLSTAWTHIVGPIIARYAQPVGLENHTLSVEVCSKAWEQALLEQQSFLLHQLKTQLPQLSIRNIRFSAGDLS